MFAARYGRLFGCDPAVVLDRDPSEIPVLVAVYEAAGRDLAAERKGR